MCVCVLRLYPCAPLPSYMRSVEEGDHVLCTIWSGGSTARAASAFSVMICVCYLLLFYYVHFVHSTLICAQSGAAVVAVRVQRARAGLEIPAKRRRAPLFHLFRLCSTLSHKNLMFTRLLRAHSLEYFFPFF